MELQAASSHFAANDIAVFAISYDSVETLAGFATTHGITYPLLSDEGSHLIDALGIRNTSVEPGSKGWGIPYPGTYFIGTDGRVTAKEFHDGHRTRDAAVTALREGFGLSVAGDGPHEGGATNAFIADASLDSSTFTRGERIGVRVVIQLPKGFHLYGQPLPEEYIPTTLTLSVPSPTTTEAVTYPAPHSFHPAWSDETLPVYEGTVVLTAAVTLTDTQEDVSVIARLDYQACTADECLPPASLTFSLPLAYRPFPT